ncbi:MAG TPA: hypothetical protein VJC03_03120, partial [bacterium]|nr:hypothetical protein [bacterium]
HLKIFVLKFKVSYFNPRKLRLAAAFFSLFIIFSVLRAAGGGEGDEGDDFGLTRLEPGSLSFSLDFYLPYTFGLGDTEPMDPFFPFLSDHRKYKGSRRGFLETNFVALPEVRINDYFDIDSEINDALEDSFEGEETEYSDALTDVRLGISPGINGLKGAFRIGEKSMLGFDAGRLFQFKTNLSSLGSAAVFSVDMGGGDITMRMHPEFSLGLELEAMGRAVSFYTLQKERYPMMVRYSANQYRIGASVNANIYAIVSLLGALEEFNTDDNNRLDQRLAVSAEGENRSFEFMTGRFFKTRRIGFLVRYVQPGTVKMTGEIEALIHSLPLAESGEEGGDISLSDFTKTETKSDKVPFGMSLSFPSRIDFGPVFYFGKTSSFDLKFFKYLSPFRVTVDPFELPSLEADNDAVEEELKLSYGAGLNLNTGFFNLGISGSFIEGDSSIPVIPFIRLGIGFPLARSLFFTWNILYQNFPVFSTGLRYDY